MNPTRHSEADHRKLDLTFRRPDISSKATARLAPYAFDYLNDENPAYGEPFLEVVNRPGQGREWLEAAVLAGYVPHLEGIELALRATRDWWLADLFDSELDGMLGDAIGATCVADAYRSLATTLLGYASEMDYHAARMKTRRPSA